MCAYVYVDMEVCKGTDIGVMCNWCRIYVICNGEYMMRMFLCTGVFVDMDVYVEELIWVCLCVGLYCVCGLI